MPRIATAQINAYAKVTSISGTTINLSNVNQTYHTFATGEQIIVMQMQDNVIGGNTSNTSTFGTLATIANAGTYEIATISTIVGGATPTSITISSALANTYNTATNGSVQIISFNLLSATNYTTTANITGVAWNGSVGGVVAFRVGGTLTLANSVSADGLGFRGGSLNTNYEVNCEPTVYYSTSTNYAFKGEGIYSSSTINYTNSNGRGSLINGGGGGSDDNGGGGGGGNFSAGGQGGFGWTCTSTNPTGGLGGVSLGSYTTGYSRLFMGGGGGSGQQNNGVGTAGTAGGGIIIISATTITTSCTGSLKISSSGLTAANSGNDGSGGAGAGGDIALQATSYTVGSGCPLTLQANGGNGGNVIDPGAHGGGGGGGQGAVIYSGATPNSNMTTTTNNGNGGSNSTSTGTTTAGGGGGTTNSGIITTSVVLPVNFISFGAARNGSQVDLSWITGLVNEFATFNVQSSADGINFNTIGTITAEANPASKNNYFFTDLHPASGQNFYRIQEVDLSNKKVYSIIASVDFSSATNTFAIFPNPSGGQFTIRMSQENTLPVLVMIDDLAGKNMYTNNFQTTGNNISIQTNGSLATGIYIIRVKSNGKTQVSKLIIK
jgi:hypothetical protein